MAFLGFGYLNILNIYTYLPYILSGSLIFGLIFGFIVGLMMNATKAKVLRNQAFFRFGVFFFLIFSAYSIYSDVTTIVKNHTATTSPNPLLIPGTLVLIGFNLYLSAMLASLTVLILYLGIVVSNAVVQQLKKQPTRC